MRRNMYLQQYCRAWTNCTTHTYCREHLGDAAEFLPDEWEQSFSSATTALCTALLPSRTMSISSGTAPASHHTVSTTQHGPAQHGTARHKTARYSTAQHSTAQHSTAQHSTAQHSTAQHMTCTTTVRYACTADAKLPASSGISGAAWAHTHGHC